MKVLPLCLCLTFLAGCATSSAWSVSTDRASPDHGVVVSHETEDPADVHQTRADRMALGECARSNYGGIADFAAVQHCVAGTEEGVCQRWRVERHYQCTGRTTASPADETVRVDPYVAPQR